ncbi:hypothetical protein N7468_001666 [Penicillium chermesinum]|uniref:Uncharacterized protein n=1 Tax=Penicillium chermesinum TaxID=63820 RepID=A0A9W9TXK6_9EURO|nr:uncharacterized protein N7468_001666 [Penicillium chermesinum]KAJ5246683.1 hypothetical protein N7468_001666 [Penicillium chermesinum]
MQYHRLNHYSDQAPEFFKSWEGGYKFESPMCVELLPAEALSNDACSEPWNTSQVSLTATSTTTKKFKATRAYPIGVFQSHNF